MTNPAPPRPEFAAEVEIWHSNDLLEYMMPADLLKAHNEHSALGRSSAIRVARGHRFVCEDAIIETFSLIATGADGAEIVSPSVSINFLNAEGKVYRIEAYMDAMSLAKFPSMTEQRAQDPAAPAIAALRQSARRTYPGCID